MPTDAMLAHRMEEQEILKELASVHVAAELEETDSEVELEEEARTTRITARHLWNLPGSVTGDQAMALAREKAADKRRKAAEKDAKEADRTAKRRRLAAQSVAKGQELLQIFPAAV